MEGIGEIGAREIREGLLRDTPLKFIDAFQKKNELDSDLGVYLLF
jgi:hypothetical protein